MVSFYHALVPLPWRACSRIYVDAFSRAAFSRSALSAGYWERVFMAVGVMAV